MQGFKTAILATSVAVLAGCSFSEQKVVCVDQEWYGYVQGTQCNTTKKMAASNDTAARLAALEKERQRLANELDAARKQNGALSSLVSDLE